MITLRRCLRLQAMPLLQHPLCLAVTAASTPLRTASTPARQSKILRKLVTGKEKAKRRWYQDAPSTPKLVTAASLSNPARQGKNAPRRVHVLNKLFMKHITDLLATGESSDMIVGRGLQVSHVKVSADFNYVNVFWSTTSPSAVTAQNSGDVASTTPVDMDAVLCSVAGRLRHELSQLRLMGEVPRIQFVRDRELSSTAQIDELLARADFGPDFEPTSWAQLREDLAHGQRTAHDELPTMRHDVLGLNQADIMDKIRRTMVKSRQAWERYADTANNSGAGATDSSTVHPVAESYTTAPAVSTMSLAEQHTELDEDVRKRDEEFAKFLEQRRYGRRLRTVRKNPDFRESYYREEYDDDDHTERFFEGDDYIEEDEPIR